MVIAGFLNHQQYRGEQKHDACLNGWPAFQDGEVFLQSDIIYTGQLRLANRHRLQTTETSRYEFQ